MALEPLFAVELATSNEQIDLDFGSWGTPIFRPSGLLHPAAEHAAAQARELIDGWLRGDVKLASYSDETGWRGSKVIYGGEVPAAIEPVPVEIGKNGRAIVKTCHRRDWRAWQRTSDGIWIECEVVEG